MQLLDEALQQILARIEETIAPFRGRVDYGNLRLDLGRWEGGANGEITNIALVYETPGGSTDQINVCFFHRTGQYSLIDTDQGEIVTMSVDEVIDAISPRITGIPARRQRHLNEEIARQLEAGGDTAGIVGHLNRMMQSGFRGGAITIQEMKAAMTFAVQLMKER